MTGRVHTELGGRESQRAAAAYQAYRDAGPDHGFRGYLRDGAAHERPGATSGPKPARGAKTRPSGGKAGAPLAQDLAAKRCAAREAGAQYRRDFADADYWDEARCATGWPG